MPTRRIVVWLTSAFQCPANSGSCRLAAPPSSLHPTRRGEKPLLAHPPVGALRCGRRGAPTPEGIHRGMLLGEVAASEASFGGELHRKGSPPRVTGVTLNRTDANPMSYCSHNCRGKKNSLFFESRDLKPRASTAEIPPGFAVLVREAKRAGKPEALVAVKPRGIVRDLNLSSPRKFDM